MGLKACRRNISSMFSTSRQWIATQGSILLDLTCWGNSPNSQGQNRRSTKRIEDYRAGYPQFCALMEAHEGFMIFRRFHRLRARMLLLKQDRISCLEAQLDQIDQDEQLPLFLAKSRGDTNSERKSVLSQIETALADYDSFIEKTHQVFSLSPAAPRDNTSLINWLDGTSSVNRQETEYLHHQEDLVSLTGPGDRATSQLEVWIEDKLIDYYPRFRMVIIPRTTNPRCSILTNHQMPSHNFSTDANVFIYSGSLIKRTVKVILLLLISFLLLLPVSICTTTTSMVARLFIIILSTALYIIILSALTKARTFELILAGATFTTILVVFVSGQGNN
ncbi:hypothetical protein GGR58DRAFT_467466 [Xylaria digitata]|nr:hypothetical protein GGR58DRAFT_467466 [Xylaria digitata]